MESWENELAEVQCGGTNAMEEDASQIACRMVVWFEALLVGILRCQILVNVLFPDNVLLVELLELGNIAHRQTIVVIDVLHRHIDLGPDDEVAHLHPDSGHCPLDVMIIAVRLLEHVAREQNQPEIFSLKQL